MAQGQGHLNNGWTEQHTWAPNVYPDPEYQAGEAQDNGGVLYQHHSNADLYQMPNSFAAYQSPINNGAPVEHYSQPQTVHNGNVGGPYMQQEMDWAASSGRQYAAPNGLPMYLPPKAQGLEYQHQHTSTPMYQQHGVDMSQAGGMAMQSQHDPTKMHPMAQQQWQVTPQGQHAAQPTQPAQQTQQTQPAHGYNSVPQYSNHLIQSPAASIVRGQSGSPLAAVQYRPSPVPSPSPVGIQRAQTQASAIPQQARFSPALNNSHNEQAHYSPAHATSHNEQPGAAIQTSQPLQHMPAPQALSQQPVRAPAAEAQVHRVAQGQSHTPIPPPQHITPVPVPQHVTPVPLPQHVTPVPIPHKVTPIPPPQRVTPIPPPQRVTPIPPPQRVTPIPPPVRPTVTPAVPAPTSAPASAPAPAPAVAPAQAQAQAATPKFVAPKPAAPPFVEKDLREVEVPLPASDRLDKWPGVENLVAAKAPSTIPQQRLVAIPMYLDSQKKPLFPQRLNPMPSEILGYHMDTYLGLPEEGAELQRQIADAMLEDQLQREDPDRNPPDGWWSTKIRQEGYRRKIPMFVEMTKKKEDHKKTPKPKLPVDKAVTEANAILGEIPHWNPKPEIAQQQAADFADLLQEISFEASQKVKALAEAKKDPASLPAGKTEKQLREDVDAARKAVLGAIEVALNKASEPVFEYLTLHKKLIARLRNSMVVYLRDNEVNSAFCKAELRFLSRCTKLSEELLVESTFTTPLGKIKERGDQEVKALVETILATAKKNKGTTKSATKSSKQSGEATGSPAKSGSKTGQTPSTKRAREDDQDNRTVKRVASDSKAPASDQMASKPAATKPGGPGAAQVSISVPKARSSTSILPGKSRPISKPAVAKAENGKAETTAAAKPQAALSRPEPPKMDLSKIVAKKIKPQAADAAKAKKTEVPKAETLSSAGKFAALMAEIAEPKKVTKPVETIETPEAVLDETPEERQRRERKEARRSLKLRVSWKNDEELTQVRLFHKEVGEDEGMTGPSMQGTETDRFEGMVFKAGAKKEDSAESVAESVADDDEDEELMEREWPQPVRIDFSALPEEKRQATFVTRGGHQTFSTDQQKFFAEREKTVLPSLYGSLDDIPPTPKSPPPEPATQTNPADIHGTLLPNLPIFEEYNRRWHEMGQFGSDRTLRSAQQRLEQKQQAERASKNADVSRLLGNFNRFAQDNASASSSAAVATGGSVQPAGAAGQAASAPRPSKYDPWPTPQRDAETYRLLTSEQLQNWRDPNPVDLAHPKTQRRHDYPDAAYQQMVDSVEEVAEKFKGKPAVASEPPEHIMHDPARVREWWDGHNRDLAAQERRAQEQQARAAAAANTTSAAVAQQGSAQTGQDANAAAWAQYYAQNPAWAAQMAAAQQQNNPYALAYAQAYQQQAQQQQQPIQQATAGVPDQNAQLQALIASLSSNAATAAAPAQQQPQQDPAAAQLQAILAGLTGGSQQAQPAAVAAPAANASDPNQAAYIAQLAQWAASQTQGQGQPQGYGQQQQQDYGGYNFNQGSSTGNAGYDPNQVQNSSNARDRAQALPSQQDLFDNVNGGGGGGGGGRNRGGAGNRRGDGESKRGGQAGAKGAGAGKGGVNPALIGTKPCHFYAQGKCAKGDKCTYRHD